MEDGKFEIFKKFLPPGIHQDLDRMWSFKEILKEDCLSADYLDQLATEVDEHRAAFVARGLQDQHNNGGESRVQNAIHSKEL